MSVFLTPELKPFFGGTYFPLEDAENKPGLRTILGRILTLWKTTKAALMEQSDDIMQQIQQATREISLAVKNSAGPSIVESSDTVTRCCALHFAEEFDNEYGGFGAAPKFPRPCVIDFLLASHRRFRKEDPPLSRKCLAMAEHTLTSMANGGIRDHIGGGFHRYSVDRYWHVPHYEKMIYDQVQLVRSYIDAYRITKNVKYSEIAKSILEYILRDMWSPEGAFLSAEDADSLPSVTSANTVEGGFYVWTYREIATALSKDDFEVFALVYDVREGGNCRPDSDPHGDFAGANILYIRRSEDEVATMLRRDVADVKAALVRSQQLLLEARGHRPRPHRDDKIVTAWNGLAMSALALAYGVFGDRKYHDSAWQIATFIRRKLYDEDRGVLYRSYRGRRSTIPGFLQDYAFVVQGLLDLYECGPMPSDPARAPLSDGFSLMQWAVELQKQQDEIFWDAQDGGYFEAPRADSSILLRFKGDQDTAEPAGLSIAARNLLRFSAGGVLSENMRRRACEALETAACTIRSAPQAVPAMLVTLDRVGGSSTLVHIVGKEGDAMIHAFRAVVHQMYIPHLAMQFNNEVHKTLECIHGSSSSSATASPSGSSGHKGPFFTLVDGKAAAYLCINRACQSPSVDLETFRAKLNRA